MNRHRSSADAASSWSADPQTAEVQRRLASALQGRLWRERVGPWCAEISFDRARAERIAADAIANDPHPNLPGPSFTTAARGSDAVRLWYQVTGCLVHAVGWDVDRAAAAARFLVDPTFDLDEGCR